MKICICDDDKAIHEQLNKLLCSYFDNSPCYDLTSFASGEALLNLYRRGVSFDIIFLDIEMGTLSGLETAEEIRRIDSKAIIIFVSSHQNYVFDSFKVNALHYIVKPIRTIEFKDVFNRAISKYNQLNSTLNLKWHSERYSICINDIMYVEGYNRHVIVHTRKEDFEAIGKISDKLKELEPHGFVQVHQGFIVNMNKIKRFDMEDIILKDGTKVMVSVRKRTEALRIYDKFIQERKW